MRFQLGLLAVMQALLLTNNVTLVAVSGLAGFALSPDKALATLPVTGYVLGAAAASMLAAALMRRKGRRFGYSVGAAMAIAGALLAAWAVSVGNLWLLACATFLTGVFNAFGASYRFAAADVADSFRPGFKARAISLVLAGGIVGGIIGPELSIFTRTMLPAMFAGSYLTLAGFGVLSLLLAQLLRLPSNNDTAVQGVARPLRELLAQRTCWIAVLTAALAYGVMNLLMVATPIAMQLCNLPYASAALVLEWHVIGMFAPGLFTGNLINRFGVLPIILTGSVLMLVCIAIALSGVQLMQFLGALFLLGVGWNFMYTGATTLLTQSYRPAEKTRVQGFNDMIVFLVMVTSSFGSGVLLESDGWAMLNWLGLPFILIVLIAVGSLLLRPVRPVSASGAD